jgi:hypothetical protein
MSKTSRNFGKAKAVVVDPTLIPPGIDTTTFFTPSIPDEIRDCVPMLHTIPVDIFREILQNVLIYLKEQQISQESYALMIKKVGTVEGLDLGVLVTGLYSIIRVAVRQKTKLSNINADLRKMNVPNHIVDDLVRVIRASRFELENLALTNRIRFPKLEKLRWRVDVIISSGSLSRVMRPALMMQVCLFTYLLYIFLSILD